MVFEEPVRLGEGVPFTRQRNLLKALDEVSANYIMTIAEVNHAYIHRCI
jgi:hypothetical protein